MNYIVHRCKDHRSNKGQKYAKKCIDCGKGTYDRWCNKCRDWAGTFGPHKHCPKCDSPPIKHELRNYDPMWHDGDVYCTKCGTRVRTWDAG